MIYLIIALAIYLIPVLFSMITVYRFKGPTNPQLKLELVMFVPLINIIASVLLWDIHWTDDYYKP